MHSRFNHRTNFQQLAIVNFKLVHQTKIQLFGLYVCLSLLAVAILTIFVTKSSFAASFDCASPSVTRPADKFICSNPAISTLDEQLVAVFNQTRAQLSESSAQSFIAGQRSWLTYWPRLCSKDGKGRQFDKAEGAQCLKEEYTRRIAELKLNTFEDMVLYKVAKYSAVNPSKNVPDYAKFVGHTLVYPQLESRALSPEKLASTNQLNAWISGIVRRANIDFNDADVETGLDVSLEATSSDIVSTLEVYYMNGFGAHPNGAAYRSHFIKSKGRPLIASDIFKGNDWINPMSQEIFRGLKRSSGDMLLINQAKDLVPLIAKTNAWHFTRNGLMFEFNPYEVAAYAAGPQEMLVSWSTLMPYLTEYAKSEIGRIRNK
jgi:uncharacterized protein